MRQLGYSAVGMLAIYAVGIVQGAVLGFAWRPIYDDWFHRAFDWCASRIGLMPRGKDRP